MASTKYNVFTATGEEPFATKSKKDAAIKAGEATGEAFYVRTDAGAVVHEYEPEVEDDGDPAEDVLPDPQPEANTVPAEDEPVFYESVDFPGNYSLALAPLAVAIADAAGVPTRVDNVKGRLNKVVWFGGDDMDRAKAVRDLVAESGTEALAALKEWQKKHRERRRGLTDMQRYLEHREQIEAYGQKVAKQVKKGVLL